MDSSSPVIMDINKVHFDVKNKVILLLDSSPNSQNDSSEETESSFEVSHTLLIENRQQLQNFLGVHEECLNIMNFSLELTSRLRDIYFAGVYSQLDKLSEGDTVATTSTPATSTAAKQIFMEKHFLQEINSLCQEKAQMFLGYLRSNNDECTVNLTASTSKEPASVCNYIISNQDIWTCFYCKKEKKNSSNAISSSSTCEELEMYLHPYVPKSFQKDAILICGGCIENWKEYRDRAIHDKELILTGEINEEICALCSDMPDSITLCSTCSRSYCSPCLKKVMLREEFDDMNDTANADIAWQCMACYNNLALLKALNQRKMWKVIKPATSLASTPTPTPVPTGREGRRQVRDALKEETTINSMMAAELSFPVSGSGPEEVMATDSKKLARQIQHNTSNSLIQKRKSLSAASSVTVSSDTATGTGTSKGSGGEAKRKGSGQAKTTTTSTSSSAVSGEMAMELVAESVDAATTAAAAPAPTAVKENDEAFYFAQYTHYIDALQQQLAEHLQATERSGDPVPKARKISRGHTHAGQVDGSECTLHRKVSFLSNLPTDDACYLCKDGGDVLECDWKETLPLDTPAASGIATKKKIAYRCYKVYHEEGCLDFKVDESIKTWVCPRHFCSICGSKELAFMCQYCPVSVCAQCPEAFVQKFGLKKYARLYDPLYAEYNERHQIQSIACESCLKMLQSILNHPTHQLPTALKALLEQLLTENALEEFPGTYDGAAITGVVKTIRQPAVDVQKNAQGPKKKHQAVGKRK